MSAVEGGAARAGEWVEVVAVVLEPGARAPSVPADTAAVPLEARVKGTLREDAVVGGPATIETVLGRRVEGRLLAVLPPVPHSFGRPVPELLPVGRELRALLADDPVRA